MFHIDQRSPLSIYEQILQNVEKMIVSGALLKNEKLPSVRTLANDLAVNPNTIQKAYGLLEERGIIYSCPGRGSFIAVDREDFQAQCAPREMETLDRVLDTLIALHVSRDEVIARVNRRYEMYAVKE